MNRFILAPLLLLAGCNLAPPHSRPALPTPAAYPGDGPDGTQAAPGLSYQSYFPDARLNALIGIGLDHNRDLAVATAQVAEAAALARIQRADQLPGLGASANAVRNRTSASDTAGTSVTRTRYAGGLLVPAFELDFWGRVRNLSAAAREQYLASAEGERAFRLSLIRSIAGAYYSALETDERVALAEATLFSRQEGLRIAKRRLDAGVTSALDFRQSESLLTQAETELAGLRLARAEALNLLQQLVGGPIPDTLPAYLPLDAQRPPLLAAGLPSDLLAARPDIIAAEAQLRAARANIGAARAAFFPSISLTGGLGYASTDLGSLFDSDGLNWTFGPSIDLPIFDWGRRRGNVDVAIARQDAAVANYERSVQLAFREVADALAGRRYLAEEVAAQQRATAAQREIARLARTRYREGVAGYLEVLDAERNLFTAEQALLSLRRQELDILAVLFAALGGGVGTDGPHSRN